MGSLMESEPIMTVGMFINVVTTGVALAVAFGLPLSDPQRDSLLVFAPAFFVFLSALLTVLRSLVFAPDTVEELVVDAAEIGATGVVL